LISLIAFPIIAPGIANSAAKEAPAQRLIIAAKDAAAPAARAAKGQPKEVAEADPVLDKISAALKQIESRLDRHDLTDSDLEALRHQLDPVSVQTGEVVDRLAPMLEGIKARLDELGPAPKADGEAPPESAEVTAERTAQQKLYSDTDELLKRARMLAVAADQMRATITAQRRALFTRSLFARAESLGNPMLWVEVWHELPDDAAEVRTLFTQWIGAAGERLDGRKLSVLGGAAALLLLLYAAILWHGKRTLTREPQPADPSRLRKVLGAWRVTLAVALAPIAAVFLIGFGLQSFELSSGALEPFFEACGGAVIRIAAAAGITLGLFAPARPRWRLPALNDAAARGVVRAATGLACLVSVSRIFAALADVTGASLPVAVAMRGLFALLSAFLVAMELWRFGAAANSGEPRAREQAGQRDWFDLLRAGAWVAVFAIAASVLAGYAAFGSFLADQLFWAGAVGCAWFLTSVLTDELIGVSFSAGTRAGQRLMASIGLRRDTLELIGVLASGLMRLVLFAVAAIFILAPWGVQSSDVETALSAAFLGFRIGATTISPASVVIAVGIFALTIAAIHTALQWFDENVLPRTRLDLGLRNSIRTSLGYVGVITAAGFALGYLGLSFEKLAIVAGALSVGIGFGLQSIVNNFVSGLILLWERAVRVGDWIVVGSDQGYVRRINVRSTEIETLDRSQVIIPNSNLVTGVVKNLVRNDRTGRLVIPLAVSGAADPEKVRSVLLTIAKANPLVLNIPSPQVLLTGMSASALNFELCVFVGDVETMARANSDLHFAVFKSFKEEGFFDTPASGTTKIEIAGFEQLSGWLRPENPARSQEVPKREAAG
jgi:small-conductance mechanosensitive channel